MLYYIIFQWESVLQWVADWGTLLRPTQSTPTMKKRLANCSAENQGARPVDKKKKEITENEWSEVLEKRERRANQPRDKAVQANPCKSQAASKQDPQKRTESRRTRTEAMIIKPIEAKTYPGILRVIRENVKPKEIISEVNKTIRQTRNESFLLEIYNKTENKKTFSKALANALGDVGAVENRTPNATLDIPDIDSLTRAEEVKKAIECQVKKLAGEIEVCMTNPYSRVQIIAIADMNEGAANELFKTARIKVGSVNCCMKRRTMVERCFKCLRCGYQAGNCKGPDRGKTAVKRSGMRWNDAWNGTQGGRLYSRVELCIM